MGLRLNLKLLILLCVDLYSLNGNTCKELSWIVQPLLILFMVGSHSHRLALVYHDISVARERHLQSVLYFVLASVSDPIHCALQRIVDFQSSGWLTVLRSLHTSVSLHLSIVMFCCFATTDFFCYL